MLRLTATTYRESTSSVNNLGEPTLTIVTKYENLKVNLQPDDANLEWNLNGKKHISTNVLRVNRKMGNEVRDIEAGDLILIHETGERHLLLGKMDIHGEGTRNHGYYVFATKFLGQNDRYSIVTRKSISAKARVKTDPGTIQDLYTRARITDA